MTNHILSKSRFVAWRHLKQRGWVFDVADLKNLSRVDKLKCWNRD